jgi:hypothetical protein
MLGLACGILAAKILFIRQNLATFIALLRIQKQAEDCRGLIW